MNVISLEVVEVAGEWFLKIPHPELFDLARQIARDYRLSSSKNWPNLEELLEQAQRDSSPAQYIYFDIPVGEV